MAGNYTCFCQKCLLVQPNGKRVSRRTYIRHRAASYSRPRNLSTRHYFCHCPEYPNGHYILSKRSYQRHLRLLRDAQLPEHDQEAPSQGLAYDSGNSAGVESDSQVSLDNDDIIVSAEFEEEAQESSSYDELPNFNDLGNKNITLLPNAPSLRLRLLRCTCLFVANVTNSTESEIDEDGWFLHAAQWAQGVSRSKYTDLRQWVALRARVQLPCLRGQIKRLQGMTEIEPRFIHCCFNNCIAYTGQYAEERECPKCGETRYVRDTRTPRKSFVYIPLIGAPSMS
jgi:hypothetical protein